jgi:hypothetical protein
MNAVARLGLGLLALVAGGLALLLGVIASLLLVTSLALVRWARR